MRRSMRSRKSNRYFQLKNIHNMFNEQSHVISHRTALQEQTKSHATFYSFWIMHEVPNLWVRLPFAILLEHWQDKEFYHVYAYYYEQPVVRAVQTHGSWWSASYLPMYNYRACWSLTCWLHTLATPRYEANIYLGNVQLHLPFWTIKQVWTRHTHGKLARFYSLDC